MQARLGWNLKGISNPPDKIMYMHSGSCIKHNVTKRLFSYCQENFEIHKACASRCTSIASRRLVNDVPLCAMYVGLSKLCICFNQREVNVSNNELKVRLIRRSMFDVSVSVTLRI